MGIRCIKADGVVQIISVSSETLSLELWQVTSLDKLWLYFELWKISTFALKDILWLALTAIKWSNMEYIAPCMSTCHFCHVSIMFFTDGNVGCPTPWSTLKYLDYWMDSLKFGPNFWNCPLVQHLRYRVWQMSRF